MNEWVATRGYDNIEEPCRIYDVGKTFSLHDECIACHLGMDWQSSDL